MIFRKVTENDLTGISRLYKVCFNIVMDIDRYRYWFSNQNGYSAIVAEEDGIIVGHNAFIINKYQVQNEFISVGLSAAGMVDAEKVYNPGTFLKLIKSTQDIFDFIDIIIAFPNKKAEPFWTKVLKFNTIKENYFFVTPDSLKKPDRAVVQFKVKRTDKFFEHRIEKNQKYSYISKQFDSFKFVFKEYNGNVELVYISEISDKLIEALEYIFNLGYSRINIISIYKDALLQYGFIPGLHNVFVYHWLNESFNNVLFECQMIDSDVF